jgi:hypothetical protein
MMNDMQEQLAMLPTDAYSSVGYQQASLSLEEEWSIVGTYTGELMYNANLSLPSDILDTHSSIPEMISVLPFLSGVAAEVFESRPMKGYDFSDADCDY